MSDSDAYRMIHEINLFKALAPANVYYSHCAVHFPPFFPPLQLFLLILSVILQTSHTLWLDDSFATSSSLACLWVKVHCAAFVGLSWMGARNHVLDGGPDPPRGRGSLGLSVTIVTVGDQK